ncbi:MAG: TIR domain-containing protein [Bacteroidota bacterium]
MNNFNRIFISYAKEDIHFAEQIYSYLENLGFEPWLDKKKLLPGQDWRFHIQDALHKADFIILLLSETSVDKRGYVQREFRQALDYYEDKLDSDIYIIPIKINDCEVPQKLTRFQWIEYDQKNLDLIQKAIDQQRAKLEADLKKKSNQLEIVEKTKKGEYGLIPPKHQFEFHYPQFLNTNNESYIELNAIVENHIIEKLLDVRANYFDYLIDHGREDALNWVDPEDSTSFGKVEITFEGEDFISYTSFISEYYTGTPHGMFGSSGMNFYKNPIRRFEFIDLFNNEQGYLNKIRNLVHEKLMIIAENEESYYSIEDHERGGEEMSPEDKRNSFYVYNEGLAPKKEYFNNYFFKANSIVFVYNPYVITAWSQGMHEVNIEFSELTAAFPNEPKLHTFINSLYIA